MTIAEATRKWFIGEWVIRDALKKGKIQGAVKKPCAKGQAWYIPDDAPNPIPMDGSSQAFVRQPRYEDVSDPVRFVRLNCNAQSIRWMARMLGITPKDVRDLYDQVLREGGDDFGGDEELEGSVL